jgi:hypothetical protein
VDSARRLVGIGRDPQFYKPCINVYSLGGFGGVVWTTHRVLLRIFADDRAFRRETTLCSAAEVLVSVVLPWFALFLSASRAQLFSSSACCSKPGGACGLWSSLWPLKISVLWAVTLCSFGVTFSLQLQGRGGGNAFFQNGQPSTRLHSVTSRRQ